MKRLFAFLLVLMMVLEMFPAAAIHAHATEIEAPVTEETVPEETSAPTEETEPATEAAEPATEPTEPAVESTEPAAEETEPVEDSVDPQLSEVSTDATAAAQSELSATIEKQIRAFAKSIDQKNADDDAALELASHGMFGRGKKLSVGKNHALTAALMNSELAQVALTRFCEKAIRSMQQLDLEQMKHAHGNIQWGGTADSFYLLYVFSAADKSLNEREWSLIGTTHYAKNRNEYDESLDWMAGCTAVRMSFERSKVAANVATYPGGSFTDTVFDRFDIFFRNITADNFVLNNDTGTGFAGDKIDDTVTILTATAGLTDKFHIGFRRFAQRFTVRHLRSTGIGFDFEFTDQAIQNNFQMQLTHTGDDGLTGFFVTVDPEGRVFIRESDQTFGQLVTVTG